MSPYYPFAPYAPPYPGYGFDRGCCAPPPSPWAPYQSPYYARPPLRPCPSYYVGGACCDECATGAPCAGASACCDACAGGAPCTCAAPSAGGAPAAMVAALALSTHPHVGALYVSDADLDALGAAVAQMGADVDVGATAERQAFAHAVSVGAAEKACFAAGLKWDVATAKCLQVEDPTHASYADLLKQAGLATKLTDFQLARWTPFQTKWNAYRAETIHAPTTYDVLRTELSTLIAEWTVPLGQKTTAVVPKPQDETNPFPWKWVYLGGALILAPFYLPLIAGAYLYLTEGKSVRAALKAAS